MTWRDFWRRATETKPHLANQPCLPDELRRLVQAAWEDGRSQAGKSRIETFFWERWQAAKATEVRS